MQMNYFVIVCTEYTECGANVGLSIEKKTGYSYPIYEHQNIPNVVL